MRVERSSAFFHRLVVAPPPPNGGEFLLRRGFDTAGLYRVRVEVTACGHDLGLPELDRGRFVLAVYEAAANAVRHGGGRGRLHLWRHTTAVYCRVSDQGRGFDATQVAVAAPPPEALHGRGLWLIHQLCAAVHIRSGADGTDIVMRFPAPPAGG
jgi:anti-sigma regulatory factor (Ser/Thr protein kinase)